MNPISNSSTVAARLGTMRRLLHALMLFGTLGLLAELLLLEHFDSYLQWIPIALLTAGLLSAAILWFKPGPGVARVFRGLMLAYLPVALLGMFLHYQSNAALEKEMDSQIGAVDLFWYAIRGSTPALAPGALLQLGILGLVLVYRHPSLAGERKGIDE